MPPWLSSRYPAFWAISAECFSRALIEMAAHVCVHACCSLILHKACQLSCFRSTFHTVQSGKGSEINTLPVLNTAVILEVLVVW